MTESPKDDPLFERERSELGRARAAFAGSVRRRLVLWAVRWTVGFAAIGVAVYLREAIYTFSTVEQLMGDFLADVRRLRGET